MAAARKSDVDFDDEARKLWARLNLDPALHSGSREYNDLDAIWRHPQTGGTIYVGNQNAAASLPIMALRNISRVVNCTSGFSKIKNFHEKSLQYYEFDISRWQVHIENGRIGSFVEPLFMFIDGALAKGESVLVHCLAGAHRAGTTGCSCLMWYSDMDASTAVATAKKLRPIIDPIAGFPQWLMRLEAYIASKKKAPRQ